MGLAALDRCPETSLCFGCVPLRLASALVALVGLLGAGALLAFYAHADVFRQLGAPDPPATVLRYSAGIFGVWLMGAHGLLAGAVAAQSEALCELWAWCMIVLTSLAAGFGGLLAAWSAALRCFGFAAGLTGAILMLGIFSIYFILVVANYKSMLP